MDEEKLKNLYEKKFSGTSYAGNVHSKLLNFHRFYLKNTHEVFSQGLVRGNTCIEVGCGPTIHSILSASKYCNRIITSDFVEDNRNQVKLWLKNDPKAIDWMHLLKYVAELEAFSNVQEGASQIAERLRRTITEVQHCDITKEYPLEKPMGTFEILISSLCLEGATVKPEEYRAALKNMSNLLKSGGKMILMGTLNCTWYMVNETKFPSACLTEELVISSLQSAGLIVESFKEMEDPDVADENADSKRVFFCLATKK